MDWRGLLRLHLIGWATRLDRANKPRSQALMLQQRLKRRMGKAGSETGYLGRYLRYLMRGWVRGALAA